MSKKVSPSTQKIKTLDKRVHVLQRPNMYIGSVKQEEYSEFTFDKEKNKIIKKNVKYTPGLLKLLDEALDNAKDNVPRSKLLNNECKYIRIEWKINNENESENDSDNENDSDDSHFITISNDGSIISIRKHIREPDEPADVEGVWEPELVFGRLMSGSNFDDSGERTTTGVNGVGVSLLNIFSTKFKVEIHDVQNGLIYKQEWRNNMSEFDKPTIKKCKVKKNMVKISFLPDYKKLDYPDGVPDEDIYYLFKKRAYDAAMLTKIPVYFNDEKIEIDSLYEYAEYYFGDTIENHQFFMHKTTSNEYSKCLIIYSDNEFSGGKPSNIAFCNGCYNSELGTHYNEWSKAIFGYLCELSKTKFKNQFITIDKIAKLFWVFIDAKLANPEFTSQTKVKVTGPKVSINLDEKNQKQIKGMLKWEGYKDDMELFNKENELKTLKKVAAKTKNTKVEGIVKANWSGGKKSLDTILIITEGLSAKTTAVKGTASQRDIYGVFPIRGKFLNVFKSTAETIAKNKVVKDVIQILNLKFDTDYSDVKNRKTLTYGHVMFCTDADTDGYHIEGLLINFFYTLFPTLFEWPEPFLLSHRTPIIRCTLSSGKKENVKNFYSKHEYEQEKDTLPKNVKTKYFKGLGTLLDKDIKEVWNKRIIKYNPDERMDHMIKLLFGKDTKQRKNWLEQYDPNDTTGDTTSDISVFLDKQMIKFSIEDCARSIPNMIDGFKESQRKIMYTCFEKNIKNEMKVAQLSGLVANFTDYKHGEQNLSETIVNMAQTFVGSNNFNLLSEDGQFGSAYEGGDDAASARYIYTKLTPESRLLFRAEDECVLEKQYEEGEQIEYKYYVPILPYILFNGCKCGIGTGYSCSIPNYNPEDIAKLVSNWIDSKIKNTEYEFEEPIPWYRNFDGKIIKDKTKSDRYISVGVLDSTDDNIVEVSCLPINYWGSRFYDDLQDLIENKKIKDVKKINNDTVYEIYEYPTISNENKFECTIDSLKLTSYISTSNIVCFDINGKLKKYTLQSLIDEFCQVRLSYYDKRVKQQLLTLRHNLNINENKIRFITDVEKKNITIYNVSKEHIEKALDTNKYYKVEDKYNYLLDIKCYQFTKEFIEKLQKEIDELKLRIKYLEETPITTIWKNEIVEFLECYEKI